MVETYGADAFRYFLVRDVARERDVEFNADNVARRYREDLANNLGNLISRLVDMVRRYCGGAIPEPGEPADEEAALRQKCLDLVPRVFEEIDALAPNRALAEVMDVVGGINGALERAAPWKQAKERRMDRVAATLYHAAEAVRLASVLLQPVLPERMPELWSRLGWEPAAAAGQALSWGTLRPGSHVVTGPPLFPRIG